MSNNINRKKSKKITSIGGSALIEGIMMRGPKKTTVAVRVAEDEIYTEDLEFKSVASISKVFRLPLIRGVFGLIDSMRLSFKSLAIATDKAMEGIEEEDEPSKFEKWVNDKLGESFTKVLMVLSTIFGLAISFLLFFMFPSWFFNTVTTNFLPDFADNMVFRSSFEGILRIALFLAYIILCSQLKDMKRVFMYHGAEHKTIACYEDDEELTVENVRKYTRFHPRCGTSFLVIMLLIAIIIGLFVPFTDPLLRSITKLLLLPLTCGIGYEIIKVCGKYDNLATRILATPGLWAQRITTKEPDDTMIEVAIKAMVSVIPENGEDLITINKKENTKDNYKKQVQN